MLRNPRNKYKKYGLKDIKTGKPTKDCGCYIIKLFNGCPYIYYGKFEQGKFYKFGVTSAEATYKNNTDSRQQIIYEEINPDAFVLYK